MWLLFTVRSQSDGRFDFVEADLGNSEMKGKRQDVALFQAFFQDYLHQTKSLRGRKNSGKNYQVQHDFSQVDCQVPEDQQQYGFEDNLTLWKVVTINENQPNYEPLDSLLKMREICHLTKLKPSDLEPSNDHLL